MATIANPIYDAVFKFLMEDQKVAKILLSALLKRNKDYRLSDSDHYLEVDESLFSDEAQQLLYRLQKAAVAPNIRREMEIEDEILSEIEARDTTIMLKDKKIEEQNQKLEQNKQEIEQKEQKLRQSKQELEQKDQLLHSMVPMLCKNGMTPDEIVRHLSLPLAEIQALM